MSGSGFARSASQIQRAPLNSTPAIIVIANLEFVIGAGKGYRTPPADRGATAGVLLNQIALLCAVRTAMPKFASGQTAHHVGAPEVVQKQEFEVMYTWMHFPETSGPSFVRFPSFL